QEVGTNREGSDDENAECCPLATTARCGRRRRRALRRKPASIPCWGIGGWPVLLPVWRGLLRLRVLGLRILRLRVLRLPVRGLPIRGLPIRGLPIRGLPIRGLPVLGLPVLGLPILAWILQSRRL